MLIAADTYSAITSDETFKVKVHEIVTVMDLCIIRNAKSVKAQTKFCMRLNNYKRAHKSFKTKKNCFTNIQIQDDHEDKDDWQFSITDQCTNNAEPRKREIYQ